MSEKTISRYCPLKPYPHSQHRYRSGTKRAKSMRIHADSDPKQWIRNTGEEKNSELQWFTPDFVPDFAPFFSKTANKTSPKYKKSVFSNPTSLHATRIRIQVRSGLSGQKIQKSRKKNFKFFLKILSSVFIITFGPPRRTFRFQEPVMFLSNKENWN